MKSLGQLNYEKRKYCLHFGVPDILQGTESLNRSLTWRKSKTHKEPSNYAGPERQSISKRVQIKAEFKQSAEVIKEYSKKKLQIFLLIWYTCLHEWLEQHLLP